MEKTQGNAICDLTHWKRDEIRPKQSEKYTTHTHSQISPKHIKRYLVKKAWNIRGKRQNTVRKGSVFDAGRERELKIVATRISRR